MEADTPAESEIDRSSDKQEGFCKKDRPEKIKGIKRKRIMAASIKVKETTEEILMACGVSQEYLAKVKEEEKRREAKRTEFFEAKMANAESMPEVEIVGRSRPAS